MNFECQGFAFSETTSELTDVEYFAACTVLNKIEAGFPLVSRNPLAEPAANWSYKKHHHTEVDGTLQNFVTSFNLLRARDRDILCKLRLYSQAFSGYQLALMRHAEPQFPWLRSKLPDNYDELLKLLVGAPNGGAAHCVQLWRSLPEELQVSLPWKFGEIGWVFDGRIANYDVAAYLCRLSNLHELGILEVLPQAGRVMEIGGGFGGLAYMLAHGRQLRYVIVDLPESLVFSAIYLSTLFPELHNEVLFKDQEYVVPDTPGFTFVPAALFDQVVFPEIDLAVNTLSFAEMTAAQVHNYCSKISANLAGHGILFEQNNEYSDERSERLEDTIRRQFKRLRPAFSTVPARQIYGGVRLWSN